MRKMSSIQLIPLLLGLIGFLAISHCASATNNNETLKTSLKEIKNFHFVSDELASSGMLNFRKYQEIKDYGFQHVINLIPGLQIKERRIVEKLGMSYEQIPVDWNKPTLEDFKQFVALMKSYNQEKVYVHCQLNWRAASFVYLYRVTQLGIEKEIAQKDLQAIWNPHDGWDEYIEKVLLAYGKKS